MPSLGFSTEHRAPVSCERTDGPPLSVYANTDLDHSSNDSAPGERDTAAAASSSPTHSRRRTTDAQPMQTRSDRLLRSAGSARAAATPGSGKKGQLDRSQKPMPTIMVVLMVPAFIILLFVATAAPQPVHRYRRGKVGNLLSLTHPLTWSQGKAEDPVDQFLQVSTVSDLDSPSCLSSCRPCIGTSKLFAAGGRTLQCTCSQQ